MISATRVGSSFQTNLTHAKLLKPVCSGGFVLLFELFEENKSRSSGYFYIFMFQKFGKWETLNMKQKRSPHISSILQRTGTQIKKARITADRHKILRLLVVQSLDLNRLSSRGDQYCVLHVFGERDNGWLFLASDSTCGGRVLTPYLERQWLDMCVESQGYASLCPPPAL